MLKVPFISIAQRPKILEKFPCCKLLAQTNHDAHGIRRGTVVASFEFIDHSVLPHLCGALRGFVLPEGRQRHLSTRPGLSRGTGSDARLAGVRAQPSAGWRLPGSSSVAHIGPPGEQARRVPLRLTSIPTPCSQRPRHRCHPQQRIRRAHLRKPRSPMVLTWVPILAI